MIRIDQLALAQPSATANLKIAPLRQVLKQTHNLATAN
jgi:hypothetical protein